MIKYKGFRMERKGRTGPGRKGRLNTKVEKTERETKRHGGRDKERQYHEVHLEKRQWIF